MKQRDAFAGRVTIHWRSVAQRFSSLLLVLLAISLIVIGRLDTPFVERARTRAADAVAPLLSVVQRPLGSFRDAMTATEDWFALKSENEVLREENARLKAWQSTALQLEAQNQVLRGMVNLGAATSPIVRTEPVIAQPGGIYVRSVLVSGGARDGLAEGQAAMVGQGLVGRITEVGAWSARILLITDLNSRIPILLEGTRTHAILAGDNSPQPYLLYLPRGSAVNIGDRIVTAGHDGIFPTGLAIGRVASISGGEVRIEPIADLDRLEYISLLESTASALTPENTPINASRPFAAPAR